MDLSEPIFLCTTIPPSEILYSESEAPMREVSHIFPSSPSEFGTAPNASE